ncbi:DUF4365 domain-containing protein [Amycolatopsis alba DSM 44262]|uniref:DUF4365 domain-containing protein n=1 Tax=Amycolatopsis alba DSM 44262 TaxID=1125972 RepID=A0A229S5N8_AMYAL|nr:DUF4365 domain-containing protein [Amycolatopsis alba DSM 44262]
MVRRPASARTASAGVTQTRHAVESGLQWVFREQPLEDYGIDAHVELVDGEEMLGRLIALQIKSGRSYFGSPADGGWWFRDQAAHFKYWLRFSVPVIVVLVDLDTGLCHWQLVTDATVEKSGSKQWKLFVPEAHVLDSSAVWPLREAAESSAGQSRQPLGGPIGSFSASDLEVHSAVQGDGVLPAYVVRAHDRALDELVAGVTSPAARSGCAILIGDSCTGKTRALYEALHRRGSGPGATSLADAGWRVWPEMNPLPPRRFLEELKLVGSRTVVWLNEAQRYLADPAEDVRAGIAAELLALLGDESRGPVLVLGTLWPDRWQELTHEPEKAEVDPFASARQLLEGNHLRVPDRFTNAEVTVARQSGDPLLVAAANRLAGTSVTQELAGATDLLRRYETAGAASQAVVHALMDARRLGHGEWFSTSFLHAATRCYLHGDARRGADEDPSWFDAAIAGLLEPGAASGPLLRRDLPGYRLDDYLDERGRVHRRFEFPLAEFWTAVAESEMTSDSRLRMAAGAAARLRWRIAAALYELTGTIDAGKQLSALASHRLFEAAPDAAERFARLAAAAGVPEALTLVALHGSGRGRGDGMSLLRQAGELGDPKALDHLAFKLESTGDKEGAEAVARRAVAFGSWVATVSVAEWRDGDFPREAEKLVQGLPEDLRWAALAEFATRRDGLEDAEGAERLALEAAAEGHPGVVWTLADERQDRGDKTAARRLLARVPDPDAPEDALRVALIGARAGDYERARRLLARVSGAREVDDQAAVIAEASPHLIRVLRDVLEALGEHKVVRRLLDRLETGQPRELSTGADTWSTADTAQTEDDVVQAYVTLAGFHARRGDFTQAESLAMAASVLGETAGLVAVSEQLLDRGDQRSAERLALCAVNSADTEWSDASPGKALAAARGDDAVLKWGLEADGSTAQPW